MTKPTRLPINKRYPGQHVIRAKLWRPHANISMEGPIPELVSDLLLALFTCHQRLTQTQKLFLRSVQENLLKPDDTQKPNDGGRDG